MSSLLSDRWQQHSFKWRINGGWGGGGGFKGAARSTAITKSTNPDVLLSDQIQITVVTAVILHVRRCCSWVCGDRSQLRPGSDPVWAASGLRTNNMSTSVRTHTKHDYHRLLTAGSASALCGVSARLSRCGQTGLPGLCLHCRDTRRHGPAAAGRQQLLLGGDLSSALWGSLCLSVVCLTWAAGCVSVLLPAERLTSTQGPQTDAPSSAAAAAADNVRSTRHVTLLRL